MATKTGSGGGKRERDGADFISAKPAPWVQAFFAATLSVILPRLGVVGVRYRDEDLARVRSLTGERVLLVPNHPTNTEPALLFHLSCAVKKPFYYLATRDAFEPFWGLWGEVIRRVGAFSVVRGTVDRASFRATRELLGRPGAHVVVFPEGEVYSQNDSLLPFHQGVFQLAFWALEDARKADDTAPLYVLPVALKYVYARPIARDIARSLARLEAFTGVTAPASDNYARLRAIGVAMLESLEREYRLKPKDEGGRSKAAEKDEGGRMKDEREKEAAPSPPIMGEPEGTPNPSPQTRRFHPSSFIPHPLPDLLHPSSFAPVDLSPRLDAIKEAILSRVASAAGVALPKGDTLPERMRALIHVIETVTRDEPPVEKTPYDAHLRREQRDRARPLLKDLRRLANWIAVYDGYVRADPTPERMADVLTRLERECFGVSKLRAGRVCHVRVGEPVDLQTRWEAYQAGKKAEVARLTHEMEAAVGALLQRGAV